MTGGSVAIMFGLLILLIIVGVLALAVFFLFKFAYVIIPTYFIGTIISKFQTKKKKKK